MSWGKHRKLQNFCDFNREKNDEDSYESFVTMYYKIKSIDSKRFMASSLLAHYQFIISESPALLVLNINNYLPIKIIQTSLMKKRFKNTFKFSNIGFNKLIFLLRKGGCLFLYAWMGNV